MILARRQGIYAERLRSFRLELVLDPAVSGDGRIGTVTNPAGEAVALDYHPGGLLKSLKDARGKTASFRHTIPRRSTSPNSVSTYP